jgi:hypothetical protein
MVAVVTTHQLSSRLNLPTHRLPCTSPVAGGASDRDSSLSCSSTHSTRGSDVLCASHRAEGGRGRCTQVLSSQVWHTVPHGAAPAAPAAAATFKAPCSVAVWLPHLQEELIAIHHFSRGDCQHLARACSGVAVCLCCAFLAILSIAVGSVVLRRPALPELSS